MSSLLLVLVTEVSSTLNSVVDVIKLFFQGILENVVFPLSLNSKNM